MIKSLSLKVFLLPVCIFCTAASALDTASKQLENAPIPALASELSSKRLLTDIVLVGDHLFAVGERGHIVYSTDGINWKQANVPVNVLLTGIKFVDDNLAFAIGHDATLIKSTDGGFNWQIVNFQPELDKPFLSIDIRGDHIVAVGAYGMFWYSSDKGKNWQNTYQHELLLEDDRLYLEEIKEFEPEIYDEEKRFLLPHFNSVTLGQHGWYLGGEGGFFGVSFNKGQSWQRIETDYYGSYFSIVEEAENKVLLAGLRGNAFKMDLTTKEWARLENDIPATINSVYMDQGIYYMFANSGNVFTLVKGNMVETSFADGKAIMAGVRLQNQMILATEAGIKSIEINKLSNK